MPRLEIITGEHAQHQFSVEKVGMWIGSDERCDIRLQEAGISRFHAQIIRDSNGGYWIEDAGSSFGTLLNGHDVERERLSDGDELTLGRVKLSFYLEDHSSPPVPSEAPYSGTSPPIPATVASMEAVAPSHEEDDDVEILDGDDLVLLEEDSDDELPATPPGNDAPLSPSHPATPTFDEMTVNRELPQGASAAVLPTTAGASHPPVTPPASAAALLHSHLPQELELEMEEEPLSDAEGTRLMRMPLPPEASSPPTPAPPSEEAPPIRVEQSPSSTPPTRQPEATVLQPIPVAPHRPKATPPTPAANPPAPAPSDSWSSGGSEHPAPPRQDDEWAIDSSGDPPPPRSRTVMFNLELEKLKHQLQEREKQLGQLHSEALQNRHGSEQFEWLERTLEMVQEDNKRLQYQITAYEEAADENERLIQQVEMLAQQNQALREENAALREQLGQYERYYYANPPHGSTS